MPLPPVRIPHPHVVIDPAVGDGAPMIEGTRVPVRRLFSWHRQGTTVETLLRRYPQLGPARIFDALAFAYDNLDLITADLVREREALARETGEAPAEEAAPSGKKERAAAATAAQGKLPFSK
jgi:uncharacterized protein (DUF433 family)